MIQRIKYHNSPVRNQPVSVRLPLSKSLSNRHLFLQFQFSNLRAIKSFSTARDTQLFYEGLRNASYQIDFQDAGTPSRFALVFFAVHNIPKIISGSSSLRKRSISDLVNTLIKQGAQIEYLEKPGFFPVEIKSGIQNSKDIWEINTQESSQFVSALMLGVTKIQPIPRIKVNGLAHSWSYIKLTQSVLEDWGFQVEINDGTIAIDGKPKNHSDVEIEIDWGSAAFVYLMALFTQKSFRLIGARQNSLQADYACVAAFDQLGITTVFDVDGALISPGPISNIQTLMHFNGSESIDLIPVLASACAFLGKDIQFTGIEKLAVKESNRIESIRINLTTLGFQWEANTNGYLLKNEHRSMPKRFDIKTFNDHRIAMAFAPWAAVIDDVSIDDTQCAKKSYPQYWEHLKMCNFELIS